MPFVDEMTIFAKAGRGGDGVVRWLHLKGKEYSGPAGGNGGNGGNVYLRAHADINLLSKYRGEKAFIAENGNSGEGKGMEGRRGEDLYIDVPRGSIARNSETGEVFELLEEGQTVMVLKGGRGGAGNRVFKSSVNQRPEESTPGTEGEEATFHIELRLIADAGLVGLPNAGKTTLLNALTGASGKIGSYAFTTLEPNLGALFGFILADIPGLIERASEGKGLGAKFLRHIARTRLLLHCVSLESENPMQDYRVVREELRQWGGGLETKPEIIILTKTDAADKEKIADVRKAFEAEGKEVTTVSALDDDALKELRDMLVVRMRAL